MSQRKKSKRSFVSNIINYETSNSDSEKKGSVGILRLNFREIEYKIELLSKYHHVKINSLPNEIKEAYDYVNGKIPLLYDSNKYEKFINLLRKYFGEHKDSIKYGTVGAYYFGCLAQIGNTFNPLCTPICINSIKNSSNDESIQNSCDNSVIIANFIKEKYNFKLASTGDTKEGRSQVYIHISTDCLENFEGFSENEKKYLTDKMGVTHVTLIGTKKNSVEYIILTDMIPVHDCKTRNKSVKIIENDYFFWIFLIIVIIIILFTISKVKSKSTIRKSMLY